MISKLLLFIILFSAFWIKLTNWFSVKSLEYKNLESKLLLLHESFIDFDDTPPSVSMK
jgi:hypothetical protein